MVRIRLDIASVLACRRGRPGSPGFAGLTWLVGSSKHPAGRVLVLAGGWRGVRVATAAFPDDELGGEALGPGRQGRVGYPL